MLDPTSDGALVEMEVALPAQSGDGDPVDANSGRHTRGTYVVNLSATEAGARLPVLLPAHTHTQTHTHTHTHARSAKHTHITGEFLMQLMIIPKQPRAAAPAARGSVITCTTRPVRVPPPPVL